MSAEGAIKGYDSGQCDVLTADVSQLFAIRLLLSKPDDHIILPDVISKEPLVPVVRQGDTQWFNIVKWVHFAMINAEELGVTSKNIDEMMKSDKPDVRRLVGNEDNYGDKIGLTNDWAARVVRLVGNYGEVFERTVGVGSSLWHSARDQSALERGRHPICPADPLRLRDACLKYDRDSSLGAMTSWPITLQFLARAVALLDPNTPEQRQALYDRARRALVDRLRGSDPTLSQHRPGGGKRGAGSRRSVVSKRLRRVAHRLDQPNPPYESLRRAA